LFGHAVTVLSKGTGFKTEGAGELSLENTKFINHHHAGWLCVVGKCVSVTLLSGDAVVVVGDDGGGGDDDDSSSSSSSSSSSKR